MENQTETVLKPGETNIYTRNEMNSSKLYDSNMNNLFI